MECFRCGGEGKIKKFSHVDNGLCFDCNGKGYNLGENDIMVEFLKDRKVISRFFTTKDCTQKIVRQKGLELGATSMRLIKNK